MLPALFEYLSRVRLKCPNLTNNHHNHDADDVVTPDIVGFTVPHKSFRIQDCSASLMSAERGGPNSVLKTRAEHFARHLNTRLRSLSDTEDGGWSAAGEQLSISSSSDNDVFYDIDSSLASPQEEAAEPQFIINANHSETSEDCTASDSTSAPSSNGPVTDSRCYDIISQSDENLRDCTIQIPDDCADCFRREGMVNGDTQADNYHHHHHHLNHHRHLHPAENHHVNLIETENAGNNARNRAESASLCDKSVKKKENHDVSYAKCSVARREGADRETWDDVDLTAVKDDLCRTVTALTINNNEEHYSHNGDQAADDHEWCLQSKLPFAEDTNHDHNGLASEHLEVRTENEEGEEAEATSNSSQIESKSNGVSDGTDNEAETSSSAAGSSKSTTNERLKDLNDSDDNLSLSDLLQVLQKEYKNKPDSCASVSCHADVISDATQTDDNDTSPSGENLEPSRSVIKKVEEEEDEDNDLRRRFRRCSSLKSGKTPPGTPGRKKIVRFADVLGLDLADVKTFLDEIPTVPRSAYSDLHGIELSSSSVESAFLMGQPAPQRSERVLLPLFQQPVGQPFFLDRVRDNNVCLENAVVSDPVLFAITGSVRVKNIDYHKSVHIRYSIDSWKTFADLQARYLPNSCDGFSDKFSFLLYAHTLDVGHRLEFAVRFQVRGAQFWDNNGGTNYVFQCVNKDPSPSVIRVTASSASAYTLHSPVDTWPSFY